jgi:hypothetical protein
MKNRILREILELLFPGRGVSRNRTRERLEGWRKKVKLHRLTKATVQNFTNCGENMEAWLS